MINLLTVSARLGLEAQFTHISYAFCVPRDTETLALTLDYSPRFLTLDRRALLEDYLRGYPTTDEIARRYRRAFADSQGRMINSLVLSLDDSEGWVGTAHRFHAGETIRVGPKSTPGYRAMRPRTGNWRATLSAYTLISPIEYTLSVNAETEGGT